MQHSILALLTAGVIAISTVTLPAQADSRDYRRDQDRDYRHDTRNEKRRDYRQDNRSEKRRDYRQDNRYEKRRDYGKHRKSKHVKSPIIHRGHGYNVAPYRIRRHRDIVVVRPYGPLYGGYGYYYNDDDAYKWLAFTAIAVKLLDNLNEQQEREHEAAQIRATTAPIGEAIVWREGNAAGYVTATREGTSSSGRYCREFQHEVTIGGKREQSYGTACRQPDGSWEVISTGQ
ncbi:MAG: hypothetical protein WBO06_13530 [Gammaproteobacteria bacterium]